MQFRPLLELLLNPSVAYVLADSVTRIIEARSRAQAEAIRAKADTVRRLIDLALGTTLGALGMGFAFLAAGAGWL